MKAVSLCILGALLLGGPAITQDQPEDWGAWFIRAVNSGSDEEQTEIITRIFSRTAIDEAGVERLLAFIKRMHAEYAPLTFHHSEVLAFDKPEGKSYLMHIYAKQPGAVMWKDFQMRLDPEPPRKLKSIGFIAEVSEPISLPNGSLEQKETLAWLSGYLDELKSKYGLYGSLLIAQGDKILFEKYYGFEDPEKKIPVSSRTLFNMASGGKMFTALSIAKLVEAGRLRYDDPITAHLKGFPDESRASRISIRHLLSHTSGIAEYWSGQNDPAVFSAKTIDDHVKLVYQSGFEFEPGTAYRYVNSNFILLGAVIEKVTGKPFDEFVRESIFDPAGMRSTGYFEHGAPGTAVPLARGKDENEWIEAVHGIKGSSAGGAYSHVRDMLRFSEALKTNAIISRDNFRDLVSPKNSGIKEAMDFEYGYGFILSGGTPEKNYGHGGTAGGVNFEFRYFPGADITLVAFCNQNNGAYDDLKKNVIKLITGQR